MVVDDAAGAVALVALKPHSMPHGSTFAALEGGVEIVDEQCAIFCSLLLAYKASDSVRKRCKNHRPSDSCRAAVQ